MGRTVGQYRDGGVPVLGTEACPVDPVAFTAPGRQIPGQRRKVGSGVCILDRTQAPVVLGSVEPALAFGHSQQFLYGSAVGIAGAQLAVSPVPPTQLHAWRVDPSRNDESGPGSPGKGCAS